MELYMRWLAIGISVAAATSTYLSATKAQACGGMFCDAGPQEMPVDQTGETIIFAVDDDHVEAHIKIEYDPDTDATSFAWIVPVMAEPEVFVGSDQLFINSLNGTVPSYGFEATSEVCDDGGFGGGDGCYDTGGGGTSGDNGGGGGDSGDTTSGGGTQVVEQSSVGAFDYVVLQSTSSADLMTWLDDNQYQQNPDAEPILDQYIAEGALFVAFRLRQDVDVAEVHPVVVRYPGSEPCVPIRLTRIASAEDLGLRVLFYGDARVVPSNYRHVELNPMVIDWVELGANYTDVVTMAVDGEGADGHAFVTEYAGPSTVVNPTGILGAAWDPPAFETLTPSETLDELRSQGLGGCEDGLCEWEHPLISGILAATLPVPEGVEAGEFYSCISCYGDMIDEDSWDPVAVAAAIDERIVAPGERAAELLETYPMLTRMFTTISPHEMTEDPTFYANPDLPEVDKTAVRAAFDRDCSGEVDVQVDTFEFQTWATDLLTWPEIPDMPWARRVETMGPSGAPIVVVDHEAAIEAALAAWTGARAESPRVARSCYDPDSDSGADSGDPIDDSDTDGAAEANDEQTQGCACKSTSKNSTPGALGAGLLLFLGWRRRRRSARWSS